MFNDANTDTYIPLMQYVFEIRFLCAVHYEHVFIWLE